MIVLTVSKEKTDADELFDMWFLEFDKTPTLSIP